MVTKTLTITQEAYDFLKRQKRGDQSFSEVIVGMKRNLKPDYSAFVGMLSKEEADSIREAIADGRKLDEEKERRLDERRRHLVSD